MPRLGSIRQLLVFALVVGGSFLAGCYFLGGVGRTGAPSYVSAAGRFQVEFPTKTVEESTSMLPSPLGEIPFTSVSVTVGPTAYLVMFGDWPLGPSDKLAQEALDGMTKIFDAPGYRIVSKEQVDIDSYRGREILMEADARGGTKVIRNRFWFVGSRMYQVMIVGNHTTVLDRQAARFYQSFKLLPGEEP